MKDYSYVFDELDSFPSGKEIFPFRIYKTHEEMWEDFNKPNFKTEGFLKDAQEATRSPVWKAVSIVTEKYKRKFSIDEKLSRKLIEYLTGWVNNKEKNGKIVSFDFLVQECSAEFKKLMSH